MLSACKKPFPTHRCGQCQYCRVIDRMDKVNRLKLEYGMRPHAFFVTLTYSDEYLPVFSNLAELYKPDLIKFIDSIRTLLPKITIFAVGEYGGHLFGTLKAARPIHPHYHLAIFSANKTINELVRKVVTDKWFMGHAHILQLSSGLIDYITGYVSKKLTNTTSMKKVMNLNIRPEFAYSSRRPAIGDISDKLIEITEQHGELQHLIIDGKKVVIPKYLKHKVKINLLKWDLDLKNPEHIKIFERRLYAKKIETLQELFEKNQTEKEVLEHRNIKKSDVKKQLILNFETRLNRSTKGMKIL